MYRILWNKPLLQWLALFVLVITTESAAATISSTELELKFGVYRTDNASVMYKKFVPILNYLEQDLGRRLHRNVSIELIIFKNYESGIDALVNNEVDFARFGPSSYIVAKDKNAALKLLVMEHKNGEKQFNGVIVVRNDSPIRTLNDLKGRSFAFGSRYSTIGRYLVQAELIKAGFHRDGFSTVEYLDRHDKVFKSVAIGEFDAGSLKETSYKRYNGNNELRVIHKFSNVTKPWIANGKMDDKIYRTIIDSLLTLTDKNILQEITISGFTGTNDNQYDFVRKAMKLAEEFGDNK